MSRIFIQGIGAVSPAGWGLEALRGALESGQPLETTPLDRPGWTTPLRARRVPEQKALGLNHPRLRRCSPISRYAAAAAEEALADAQMNDVAGQRIGIVFCVTSGCIQYSRRFYDETLRDPATASPLLFPETVFNAPASHLGAMLGLDSINYTLVGDPGTFLQALALAAQWLITGKTDACVVVAAEELDWVTADASHHFARHSICAEGAAGVVLSGVAPSRRPDVELTAITGAHLYLGNGPKARFIEQMRSELPPLPAQTLLCDSRQGTIRDANETAAWNSWSGPRLSPRKILGDALMAAAGWQCAAAIDAIRQGRHPSAVVSAAGGYQQAIGAVFSIRE